MADVCLAALSKLQVQCRVTQGHPSVVSEDWRWLALFLGCWQTSKNLTLMLTAWKKSYIGLLHGWFMNEQRIPYAHWESVRRQTNPISHPSGVALMKCTATAAGRLRKTSWDACKRVGELQSRRHYHCNTVCSRSNRELRTKVLTSISCAVSTHHLPSSCICLLKSFKLWLKYHLFLETFLAPPSLICLLVPHSYIIASFEYLS